jgi:hypothetical protein
MLLVLDNPENMICNSSLSISELEELHHTVLSKFIILPTEVQKVMQY